MRRYCGSERPPPGRGRVAQRIISTYIWGTILVYGSDFSIELWAEGFREQA
jgi:hypothetical protein